MKRFYFKDEVTKISKTYGNATHNCTIYTITKGELKYLGQTMYNSASTMGAKSEVHKWLIDNKKLAIALVKKQQEGTSCVESKKGYSEYYFRSTFYTIEEV